jgi:hypothetical protein
MCGIVVLGQDCSQAAFLVLHSMTFVDNHIVPRNTAEHVLVGDDRFVLADDDVELFVIVHARLVQLLAHCLGSLVRDGGDGWCPLGKFIGPVRHGSTHTTHTQGATVISAIAYTTAGGDSKWH